MQNLSLRTRIFLSFFVLIALSASIMWWVVNQQIEDIVNTNFEENFDAHMEVAFGQVEDYLASAIEEPDGFDKDDWDRDMRQLSADLEITVELFELNGEIRLYSTNTGFREQAVEIYPEVELLLEEEISELEQYEELEQAARADVIYYEDEPEIILRVSQSNAESSDQRRTQTLTLTIGTAVGGLLLLLLLGGWLANALTRPLTQLRGTAQAMAAGNLDARADTNAPTEIQLLAEDFNQMATAVEGMVAEQRAFASNAAHELRTPLTGIRLRLETLLEDDPDEELLHRYLTEIDNEAARLGRLVQDLRVLSHSDARQIKVGADEVYVGPILEALAREFAPQIREKRLRVEMAISAEIPPIVASRNHIRTILRNLIENAVKYTPDGESIHISLAQVGDQVVTTVKDSGIGISADDLPKLFNRFYRVDPSRNRKIPGSGLGLSLAQSIAHLYNGEIIITSEGLGKGSTAQLRLPTAL